jgi:hypothetical protein
MAIYRAFKLYCTLQFESTNNKENMMEHNVVGWGKLACIYLSCKVEEFHVFALEELGKGI